MASQDRQNVRPAGNSNAENPGATDSNSVVKIRRADATRPGPRSVASRQSTRRPSGQPWCRWLNRPTPNEEPVPRPNTSEMLTTTFTPFMMAIATRPLTVSPAPRRQATPTV